MNKAHYILASSSPQRKILLERLGVDFSVQAIDCAEDLERDESAEIMVERICRTKMAAALSQLPGAAIRSARIITSDTLVSLEHHRLGKPETAGEAEDFLRLLSGRTHQVLTAICLAIPTDAGAPAIRYGCSASDVSFIELTDTDIAWYLASQEWQGAAGGYRIQGKASCFINQISGSPTGIMGLPLELLYGMLADCRGL